MLRTPRRPRRVASMAVRAVFAGWWATGCSDGPGRATEDYCSALTAQHDLLVAPIVSVDDVDDAVGRYLDMSRRAPLAVEEQWQRLAALMQAAATVDAGDAAARLRVIEQAYETKRDADAIVTHAASTCGITIDISGTTTTTTTTTTAPASSAPAGANTTPSVVAVALPVETAATGTTAAP